MEKFNWNHFLILISYIRLAVHQMIVFAFDNNIVCVGQHIYLECKNKESGDPWSADKYHTMPFPAGNRDKK